MYNICCVYIYCIVIICPIDSVSCDYIPNSLISQSVIRKWMPFQVYLIKRQSSTRGVRCPKPWVADQPRQPSRWELRDPFKWPLRCAGGARSFLRRSPIWSYIPTDLTIEFEQSSCWVCVLEKEARPLQVMCSFKFDDRMDGQCGDCHWVLGAFKGISLLLYIHPLLFLILSTFCWEIIIDWRLISISIS